MDEFVKFMEKYLIQVQQVIDELTEEEAASVNAFVQEALQYITEATKAPEIPIEPPTPPEIPKLTPGPFPSSNINSFMYNPENEQLFVKFHGKDTAGSGPTYSYQGIPEYIFDIFRRGAVGPKTSGSNKYHTWYKGVTPSLGAAMYALIKQGPYSYRKVA